MAHDDRSGHERRSGFGCDYPDCPARDSEDKTIGEKVCLERRAACDKTLSHLMAENTKMDIRIGKIESWGMKILLGGIVILLGEVLNYLHRPDTNAIAAQVIQALRQPHP